MPAEIADLADGVWQRALKLAGEAAKNDDNAARERLKQIQFENELKARSFVLREAEWDTSVRERERALVDSREHLLLTLKALDREQATLQSREVRIADLEVQAEQYRRQIASMIAATVVKNRSRAPAKKGRLIPVRAAGRRAIALSNARASTGSVRAKQKLAVEPIRHRKSARKRLKKRRR
jgi:hypothetical protein